MKILGNDIYIQRGETWSLDFDVIGEDGEPYMIMKEWKNPYLAITVTSARYEQDGDFRKTYWLDLSKRFVEQADGSMKLVPIKKFISTEALYLKSFLIEEAIAYYGVKTDTTYWTKISDDINAYEETMLYDDTIQYYIDDEVIYDGKVYKCIKDNIATSVTDTTCWTKISDDINAYEETMLYDDTIQYYIDDKVIYKGKVYKCIKNNIATPPVAGGKIVLDSNSDFDITNFLFFIDEGSDNKKVYKYVKSYTVNEAGKITKEVWEEYNFRIIKQFRTNDWIEQTYLFDIKVLSGESVKEHIANILGKDSSKANEWSDTETREYINQITDDVKRLEMQKLFESAIPIMPDYDIKSLILMPTNLYVSANIQGRY